MFTVLVLCLSVTFPACSFCREGRNERKKELLLVIICYYMLLGHIENYEKNDIFDIVAP